MFINFINILFHNIKYKEMEKISINVSHVFTYSVILCYFSLYIINVYFDIFLLLYLELKRKFDTLLRDRKLIIQYNIIPSYECNLYYAFL